MWQDTVLTLAQLVFVISLVPSILQRQQKPPLLTSVPTVMGLVATTVAFASLSLWWSALMAACLTTAWGILAYQGYQLRKGPK